jgi:hypothetical protein
VSVRKVEDDAMGNRHVLAKFLELLDDKTIKDLVRRGQHRPAGDGFSPGSLGSGGSHGPDVARPTEQAAIRLGAKAVEEDEVGQPDSWEEWEWDLVANALDTAFRQLGVMAGLARSVRRRIEYVLDVYKKSDVRQPGSGICRACLKQVPGIGSDRLRSGYCDACRKAWARADYPDRVEFEFSRRPEGVAAPDLEAMGA